MTLERLREPDGAQVLGAAIGQIAQQDRDPAFGVGADFAGVGIGVAQFDKEVEQFLGAAVDVTDDVERPLQMSRLLGIGTISKDRPSGLDTV